MSSLVLAVLAALALALHLGAEPGADALALGYGTAALAALIGYRRGGITGYPLWITLMVAYPILTPPIVQGVIGLPYFSARATGYQDPEHLAAPVLIAAVCALFLSVAISRAPVAADVPATRGADLWLVLVAAGGTLFFGWLTEPGRPMGLADYADIRAGRIPGTPFAGGAWLVFAAYSVALWHRVSSAAPHRNRRWKLFALSASLAFSLLWLLSHARRSEPTGFLILLLCLFGHRMGRGRVLLYGGAAFVALAAIGYLRNGQDIFGLLSGQYVHLPGAPGNVLIGYVAAYWQHVGGGIPMLWGESYAGHVLRLPPAFLGLPRPPIAYDYVQAVVPLTGGEYLLIEPMLNGGIGGMIPYLVVFTVAVNASIRAIRRYWHGQAGTLAFLLATATLGMLFRTAWYGAGAWIKTVIIAGLVGATVLLLVGAARRSHSVTRSRFTSASSVATVPSSSTR